MTRSIGSRPKSLMVDPCWANFDYPKGAILCKSAEGLQTLPMCGFGIEEWRLPPPPREPWGNPAIAQS